MTRLFRNLTIIFLVLLVLAIKLFIALAIISILIVPLTWIYSKIIGQSYNFTIDQSDVLYKLNKFGMWMFVFGIAASLCFFIY